MTTTGRENILVGGGYSMVGRSIASVLAARYPGRLVIAGRSAAMAQRAAAGIGHGATGQALDIGADDVPDGTRVAVVCVDALDARFAKACLGAGRGLSTLGVVGRLVRAFVSAGCPFRVVPAGRLQDGATPGGVEVKAPAGRRQ